jgi:hypothetical protein
MRMIGFLVTLLFCSGSAFGQTLIVNGSFAVWQNLDVFTTSFTVDGWGPDHWYVSRNSGTHATITRQAANSGSGTRYKMRVQRNNGSNVTSPIDVYQPLLTSYTLPLVGNQATLSFSVQACGGYSGGSLQTTIHGGTGIDQGVSALIAGDWDNQTRISIHEVTLSTTRTRFSHTFSIGAEVTQIAVQFRFSPKEQLAPVIATISIPYSWRGAARRLLLSGNRKQRIGQNANISMRG